MLGAGTSSFSLGGRLFIPSVAACPQSFVVTSDPTTKRPSSASTVQMSSPTPPLNPVALISHDAQDRTQARAVLHSRIDAQSTTAPLGT